MDTNEDAKRRSRRRHDAELKRRVLAECEVRRLAELAFCLKYQVTSFVYEGSGKFCQQRIPVPIVAVLRLLDVNSPLAHQSWRSVAVDGCFGASIHSVCGAYLGCTK